VIRHDAEEVMRIVQCDLNPWSGDVSARVAMIRAYERDTSSHTALYVRLYVQTTVGGEYAEITGPDGAPYSYCAVPSFESVDGDEAANLAISCVAIRPGDTDSDYFADYTEDQLAFCEAHGEHLSSVQCDYERDEEDQETDDGAQYQHLPWREVEGDDPTDLMARVYRLDRTGGEVDP
jgi:hypothetical protein